MYNRTKNKIVRRSICLLAVSGAIAANAVNGIYALPQNALFSANLTAAAAETGAGAAFSVTSATVGQPLNLTLTGGITAQSYAWAIDGTAINYNGAAYTPTADDLEHMISVTVTASDGNDYSASLYFSTLPVVYIDTEGGAEVTSKTEYLGGICKILGNDEYKSSTQLYNGAVKIRGRGNYTWEHDKKPYKIKLDSKADLLGMGANKHWVLIAEYVDPTHIRNDVMPKISEALHMEYTAECRPVILVLNGEYNGLYHLSENIRIGSERVNIYDWEETAEDLAKAFYTAQKANGMTKDERDVLEDALVKDLRWITDGTFTWNGTTYFVSDYLVIPSDITGGYLLELDTYDEYHVEQISDFDTENDQPVQFKNPEYACTNDAMFNYAKNYIQSFENAVMSADFYTEADGQTLHYSQLFDMDSLVKYWLMLELTSNSDGMRYSNYMYKDFGSLFKLGPAWDYDWTWNAGYTVPTDAWWVDQFYYNDTQHWLQYLVSDPYFLTEAYLCYQDAAEELTQMYADGGWIDQAAETVRDAAAADLAKWRPSYVFDDEIEKTKTYVTSRYTWLDAQFASVDTLMDSLGLEQSEKISIDSISASGSGGIAVTVSVSDASAKTVTVQMNGLHAASAPLQNGKATLEIPVSYLKSDAQSLNTLQVRAQLADGSYLITKTQSSGGGNQNPWGGNPWGWAEPEREANSSDSAFTVFTAAELGIQLVRGDVNNDGSFTLADLVMMQKYLLSDGDLTVWKNGDFDGSGTINAKDLTLMKQLYRQLFG